MPNLNEVSFSLNNNNNNNNDRLLPCTVQKQALYFKAPQFLKLVYLKEPIRLESKKMKEKINKKNIITERNA